MSMVESWNVRGQDILTHEPEAQTENGFVTQRICTYFFQLCGAANPLG